MKIFKKLKSLALTSILTSTMVVAMAQVSYGRITLQYDGAEHLYTATPINLIVNDTVLTDLPLEPIIIDGRTLVPAREVFEELGAVVDYKPISREVFIGYEDNLIVLTIDSNEFYVNDLVLELEVAPKIINNKTMLPFRAVAEAIGLNVEWDDTSRSVKVSDDTQEITVPVVTETPEVEPIETPETEPEKPTDVVVEQPTTDNTPTTVTPPPSVSYGKAIDKSTTTITNMTNPHTSIVSVTLPGYGLTNEDSIVIKSTGPMSTIDKFLLEDNRLVIDIHNSTNSATTNQIGAHPSFTAVRTGQNQVNPIPITRVVTDLTANTEFSVELSADRTELRIVFTQNKINNISFEQNGDSESIKIFGDSAPGVVPNISLDRSILTLDLPSSVFLSDINYDVSGQYVTNVLATKGQNQVVLNLKNKPGVSIKQEGLFTTITFSKMSDGNLVFDVGTNTAIIKKSGTNITANTIQLDERFIVDKKLTVKIDGDYKDYLGYNTEVNSSAIQSYSINSTTNGQTEIVFMLQYFGTFGITETNEYIYLTFKNPKELYSKIVVIDAGHGGHDPGVVANGINEKDINLALALKLQPLLESAGYKVYMTRSTDRFIELVTIGQYSSAMGDLMLSLHANSAGSNTLPTGIETLWYFDTYDTNNTISSKKAATVVQSKLIDYTSAVNRGPKESALIIFKNSTVPSILAEVGFLTNYGESRKLLTTEYQDTLVKALTAGVNDIFASYTPSR